MSFRVYYGFKHFNRWGTLVRIGNFNYEAIFGRNEAVPFSSPQAPFSCNREVRANFTPAPHSRIINQCSGHECTKVNVKPCKQKIQKRNELALLNLRSHRLYSHTVNQLFQC